MVRIGLIIERADFAISAASVERMRLSKRLVGFQTKKREVPLPCQVLQTKQDALADAKPAGGWRHPHPLDFAIARMALQSAAADGFPVECRQNQEPLRRRQGLRVGRNAARRIEASLEALGKLLEVAPDAVSGRTAARILHAELDGAGEEQALNGMHRRDERFAL